MPPAYYLQAWASYSGLETKILANILHWFIVKFCMEVVLSQSNCYYYTVNINVLGSAKFESDRKKIFAQLKVWRNNRSYK